MHTLEAQLPLVQKSAPYHDILVAKGPIEEKLEIAMDLQRHSFLSGSVFIRTSHLTLCDGFLAGAAVCGQTLFLGPMTLDKSTPKGRLLLSSELRGQYILIQIDRHERITVSTDPFGLFPIFYYKKGPNTIVASGLHLLSLALRATGLPVELNIASMAATWIVDNSLCVQQATFPTIVRNVHISRPGQKFSFTSDDVGINCQTHKRLPDISKDEYWDYIKSGAEEIKENILAALNSGRRTIANLTGGRDSRVIFAALHALGATKDVGFHTRDIDDVDSMISSGLVLRFGGHYARQTSEYLVKSNLPEDNFARHRSRYFGTYHDFKKSATSIDHAEHEIRLIGGCGETFRGFYSKNYRPELLKAAAEEENYERLLASHTSWRKILSERLMQEALPCMVETLSMLPGETVGERMENHYLFFRNRLHFGATSVSRPSQSITFQALASPSLLELSQRVDMVTRQSGRIVFDVTRHLSELCAYLPYRLFDVSDYSSMEFHLPSKYDGKTMELEPRLDLLHESIEQRRLMRKGIEKPVPDSRYNSQVSQKLYDRLRSDGVIGAFLDQRLQRRIKWLEDRKSKFFRVWLSRLAAAYDVLALAAHS